MPRNDSLLYAGSSSRRPQKSQDKQERKRRLLPVADDVFNEIEKLKEKNRQRLVSLVNQDTREENVQAILLGVRFNEEDLVSLQNILKTILRDHKEDEAEDE